MFPFKCAQEFTLPSNLKATTSVAEALTDAQFAVHAVPVQHSRRFLSSIKVGDGIHQYVLMELQALQQHFCMVPVCRCISVVC
jgi:glycerol-3-phosphate dehydrogenase